MITSILVLTLICTIACDLVPPHMPAARGTKLPKLDSAYRFFEVEYDGSLTEKICATILNGEQMVFNQTAQRCEIEEHSRVKRQSYFSSLFPILFTAVLAVIGSRCTQNTECGGGNQGFYCDSLKGCQCLPTFANYNGICWQKVDPGNACQGNWQCTANNPSSYCDSSGICRCSNNRDPIQTNEGPVCSQPSLCPTGGDGALYYESNGQTFNCRGSSLTCPLGYFCVTDSSSTSTTNQVSYCCPGRGLTCVQPRDSGTSGSSSGSSTRYYYDSNLQSCRPFTYYGSGGNANNFANQASCQSWCQQYCPRGSPQGNLPTSVPSPIGTGGLPNPLPIYTTPVTCTTSSNCDTTNYECKSYNNYQYCCPKPTYICSQKGGMDYTSQTPVIQGGGGWTSSGPNSYYDAGFSNPNRATTTTTRYFFDTRANKCSTFTYYGHGGNFNNFASQSSCEQYCSKTLCTAGEPLKDTSQLNPINCGSSSSACPSTYTCTNSVCCLTASAACSLGPASGYGTSGSNNLWYYNSQFGYCQQFAYYGTGGNANRFDTRSDCEDYCSNQNAQADCPQGQPLSSSSTGAYLVCGGTRGTITSCSGGYYCNYDGTNYGCCPTRTTTCSATYDAGTVCSGPSVSRWYYDSSSLSCKSFTYNGCDGNSNNFATRRDCEEYCFVGGCNDGGEPFRDGANFRACGGTTGCPTGYGCQSIVLSTQNNFGSFQTGTYCCPTKTTICSQPRDQGVNCAATTISRYYFNSATRNCEAFSYGGCGGNRNNYASATSCLNYCNSAACPSGTIAFRNTGSNTLVSCTVGTNSGCPSGYSCVFSTLLGQGICCGSPVSQSVCGGGLQAYFDAQSNQALQCIVNSRASCPSGFNCRYNSVQNAAYCCGSSVITCPQGGQALFRTGTTTAETCTPGLTNACPNPYTCQSSQINVGGVMSTVGYCCGQPGLCSNNGAVQTSVNNQPVTCSPTISVCGSGFQCLLSNTGGIGNTGYCCSQNSVATTQVCGTRNAYTVNNNPVICQQGNTLACPASYQCTLYPATNQFYCCGSATTPANTQVCPPGLNPVQTNNIAGQYQRCSPSVTGSCSVGFCQSSPALSSSVNPVFICCSNGATNPTNTQAQCPTNGQVSTTRCTNGQCPIGQSCMQLTVGSYCCRMTSSCPAGDPITINSQGTPQSCSGNTCPNGYQCQSSVCCPNSATVCNQPQNAGTQCTGGASTTRYYYNPSTRQCAAFSYNGCGGGSNNFPSQQSCQSFCSGNSNPSTSQCPTNYEAQTNSFNQPQPCTPQFNTCNNGYQCLAGGTGFYCCRPTGSSTSNQFCPSGLNPELSSGNPRLCLTSGTSICSVGYQCYPTNRFGTTSGIGYCCAGQNNAANRNICPGGQAALFQGTTPVTCSPSFNTCQGSYSCVIGSTNQFVCCPASASTGRNGCATGDAFLYPGLNEPLACQPSGFPCPQNYQGRSYQCSASTTSPGRFQCCTGSSANPSPSLQPITLGSSGCSSDTQCTGDSNGRCIGGRCLCASNLLVYQGRCVTSCPYPYRNVSGVCSTSSFFSSGRRRRRSAPCTSNCKDLNKTISSIKR